MTGTPAIRDACGPDLDVILTVEVAAFGPDAWSGPSLAATVEADRGWFLVASRDRALVGYAVARHGTDVADLLRVAVDPVERRTGVGSHLVTAVAARASGAGCDRLLLEVSERNLAAATLYARLGFVEIDRRRRYYRDEADALVLELALPGPAGARSAPAP